MKFHIIKEHETLSSIAAIYGLDPEELNLANEQINMIVGSKIKIPENRDKNITKNIEDIYQEESKEKTYKRQDEKYICPYCKNIILIPPKK